MPATAHPASLPRVTYSNITADFSGVHALLDRLIPLWRNDKLGQDWPNWVAGAVDRRGRAYVAASPIDGAGLGRFYAADAGAIADAVAAARAAWPHWSSLHWSERVAIFRRAADLLNDRKYDLAVACLLEVGKSRLEAVGEAEEAVDLIRYYCDQMEANQGYEQPLRRAFPAEETRDRLRPLGVFAVIAPFNFPLALSVNMLTGALLTGNCALYKPSPNAGLTGALLTQLFLDAGLPPKVLSLLSGDGETGRKLADAAGIDGFVFTGSHKVGMELVRKAAAGPHLRPVIAEMGGKNPSYVTARADLDNAVEGVTRSAFGLQGQKCSAGSKVYVERAVLPEFLERLMARIARITVGDPAHIDVFMGPLIDQAALTRFERASNTARREGQLLCGGMRLTGGLFDQGAYAPPTVVAHLPPDHWINRDELFLPFLSVQSFTDLDAAIQDGNSIAYGLTAGIYTHDDSELTLFLDRAEAGVLYANRPSGATTGAWPGIQSFCGWKGSGTTGKGGLGPYYLPQFMREQSLTLLHR